MAATQDSVSAVVVLGILLAVMMLNHFQAKRAAAAPRAPSSEPGSMLGRYAVHQGSVAGEVVAITTDRLVLRQGGTHRAVPLSQARLSGSEVVLEGDVDWAAAEEAGRSWSPEA